ncbi:PepSY domain-containing protein [Roseomonas sp. 18066]|uniref:PepSY domain-containing protein n=1 Tax=Roseomonas sp. 18066 TaxID=2681412 RepID=UPI0013584BEC|nr:PepSY domain-containing protein [Roseomonas sp. 18066]
MSAFRHLLAVMLLVPSLAFAQATAERPPSEAERGRLEQALRDQGFRDWGKIQLDRGIWEVEDAMDRQGARRDLRILPGELRIVATDIDDRLANTEETMRIEASLRRLGYREFGRIKLDDGLWNVDRALAADGQRYDLTLERETLRVLYREREG